VEVMPIDDALETLEEVPEYALKEPISNVPETIEELQEKYNHKFIIENDKKTEGYINISTLKNNYKDIIDNNQGVILYSVMIASGDYGEGIPIKERDRYMILLKNCTDNDEDALQFIHKSENNNFEHHDVKETHLSESFKSILEKWFNETEAFILKEIPELEEFVKNYAN
jgi:hypothetical protein